LEGASVTQAHHNTVSSAFFTRAWTEFCRTSDGRHEYWRRFGDYLFKDPPREIPRELLSLPPLRPRSRRRQRQPRPLDGLHTASEAAAKLRCSIKTLNGYVAAGALKYVIIGHGTKRPRKTFTDADLDEFIAAQTRKDVPACPSSARSARRTGITTSNGEVIGFTARRNARLAAKPKK
jgi:hypothetical protein